MCKILEHLQGSYKDLLLAFKDFDHFGLGLQAMTGRTDVHQHAVSIQGVHRVALGDHDGQSVIAGSVHTVLAVATTNENTLGHRRAVSSLITSWAHLDQETINCQLLKYLNNHSTSLGRIGTHSCRHLLVVERSLALLIKKIDDPIVKLTTLLSQRLQSAFSCHILVSLF